MKSHLDRSREGPDAFSGDLRARLEVVQDRVGAESIHLDQVAAVAESYVHPLPARLRLVRWPSPRSAAPHQRWNGLLSASLEELKNDSEAAPTEAEGPIAEDPEVDDLISKAAVAVDGHAAAAQVSRLRMSRLSADAAASLRSAIAGECPTAPGQPSRGTTSGSRLDVQR